MATSGKERRQRMMTAAAATLASPLIARALALEVSRLEKLRFRAWQALSAAIVAASLSLAAASTRHHLGTGLGSAAVGVVAFLWFTAAHKLLVKQKYNTFTALVTFLVEQGVPWMIFMAVFWSAGAAEATRVWGPPLAYTGMLILTTLKLSPRYSVLTGVLGGASYLVLSFVVVRPQLADDVQVETIAMGPVGFAEAGDCVRAVMLITGGFVVAVVASGLRNAVGGVVSALREQDLFGKYRLEREIAGGGMGVVWLATYCPEGGFARAAAVKLVHPHLAKDTLFVDAFRREAELCARLVHQNIVQVFDFGRVDERYFLAMEFVDGITLRDVMKRAHAAQIAVPPVVAGAIMRQVLAGLHFAHVDAHDGDGSRLRVIHRDLAPSNILVSKGGEVKITDFGVAKALRNAAAANTQTVAGHFDHMAPEQTSAGALDERTDLFCAGILLWELLVGVPLFRRDSDAATLFAVSRAPVQPPSSARADLGTAFDAVCAKALAREPGERYQTAREMSAAVREAAGPAPPDAIASFIASLPALKDAAAAKESQPSTRVVDVAADEKRLISQRDSGEGPVTANQRPTGTAHNTAGHNGSGSSSSGMTSNDDTATLVDGGKSDASRDTTLLDQKSR